MVKTTIAIETETRNLLKQIARRNQTYDQLISGLIERNRGLLYQKAEGIKGYEPSSPPDLITSSFQKVTRKINNTICEAVGCEAKAATEIQVDIGQSRSIILSLCNNCVNKFSNSAKPETEEIEKI